MRNRVFEKGLDSVGMAKHARPSPFFHDDTEWTTKIPVHRSISDFVEVIGQPDEVAWI